MPTNEERREAASMIRNAGTGYASVWQRLRIILGMPKESTLIDVRDMLADLIEPRTCRKVPGKMKYGRRIPACSECGYSLGDKRWKFCPKCGCEVMKDAD